MEQPSIDAVPFVIKSTVHPPGRETITVSLGIYTLSHQMIPNPIATDKAQIISAMKRILYRKQYRTESAHEA